MTKHFNFIFFFECRVFSFCWSCNQWTLTRIWNFQLYSWIVYLNRVLDLCIFQIKLIKFTQFHSCKAAPSLFLLLRICMWIYIIKMMPQTTNIKCCGPFTNNSNSGLVLNPQNVQRTSRAQRLRWKFYVLRRMTHLSLNNSGNATIIWVLNL